LDRFHDGEQLELLDDPAWFVLTGGDLAWADYTYKRDDAIERLGALAQLLRAVGLGGVVLIFDEAETIDQLWNIRSRVGAYTVLGRLSRLPAVWCVFGITARFDRTVGEDLSRIASERLNLSTEADWFLECWSKGRFRIIVPPAVDRTNAAELANAVGRLYRLAYPSMPVDEKLIRGCLQEWNRNPSQNPRRLIRLLIHRLDVIRPV
jgi:hypothetical protein